jgi:hypothetical protein
MKRIVNRAKSPKPVKSFRPSQRVQDMLAQAKDKTGRSETFIIEKCILFALSHKGVLQ